MEGEKGGNFSKAPKSLFLLKIKIEQTQATQITSTMQYHCLSRS